MAKLKADINFLKASGASKKLKLQASMSVLYIILIIVIVGVLGGMLVTTLIETKSLERDIAFLESEINDPQRAKTLAEYLKDKGIVEAIKTDNKRGEAIKAVLEKKYKVPVSAVISMQELLDEISLEIDNKYLYDIKKVSFDSLKNAVVIEVEFKKEVVDLAGGEENFKKEYYHKMISTMISFMDRIPQNQLFKSCESTGSDTSFKDFAMRVTMRG